MGSNKKIKVTYTCNNYYYHIILEHLHSSLYGPKHYYWRSHSIIYHTQLHTQAYNSVQLHTTKSTISSIHKVVLLTAANILLQI